MHFSHQLGKKHKQDWCPGRFFMFGAFWATLMLLQGCVRILGKFCPIQNVQRGFIRKLIVFYFFHYFVIILNICDCCQPHGWYCETILYQFLNENDPQIIHFTLSDQAKLCSASCVLDFSSDDTTYIFPQDFARLRALLVFSLTIFVLCTTDTFFSWSRPLLQLFYS